MDCLSWFRNDALRGVLGPFWGWLIALPACLRSSGIFSRTGASNRETGRALGLEKREDGLPRSGDWSQRVGVRELASWIAFSCAVPPDFLSFCLTWFENIDLRGVLEPFWGWLIAVPAFLRSPGFISRPGASNRVTGRALGLEMRNKNAGKTFPSNERQTHRKFAGTSLEPAIQGSNSRTTTL